MEMTPAQIASEYRTGKDKTKTIKVLAELNLVTQRRIAEILQDQGEQLPGHWIEKLEKGLKTAPRGRAMTTKEVDSAILEAVTPGGSAAGGPGDPSTPLRFAQDDSAALSPDGDPASRAGRISWPQYSRLANLIGRLEGAGCALPDHVAIYYFDTLELLNALVNEIKPIVDMEHGETDCRAGVRAGSQ